MMLVVHLGDGLAEGLDSGGRGIFSAGNGNIDMGGPLEAAFNVILDLATWEKVQHPGLSALHFVGLGGMAAAGTHLRSTLAQVGPSLWLFEVAELTCSLRAPDHTSRGPRGIETSMWQVTPTDVDKYM
jgi:hypothetical protein